MEGVQIGIVEHAAQLLMTALGPNTQGILGLGQESSEKAVMQGKSTYPNVLAQLKQNKLINALAFSLYLNDPSKSISSQARLGAILHWLRGEHVLMYGILQLPPPVPASSAESIQQDTKSRSSASPYPMTPKHRPSQPWKSNLPP